MSRLFPRSLQPHAFAVIGLVATGCFWSVEAARAQTPTPTATPTPTSGSGVSNLPVAATVQLAASTAQTNQANAPAATPQPLSVSSPDLFAPTSLAAQPQPATVTLSYNVACAGAGVVVAPLDGGMINGSAGAKTVMVGMDGTLSFTFQPPAGPGRYHVVTRLAGSEMGLPFDVAAAGTPPPSP